MQGDYSSAMYSWHHANCYRPHMRCAHRLTPQRLASQHAHIIVSESGLLHAGRQHQRPSHMGPRQLCRPLMGPLPQGPTPPAPPPSQPLQHTLQQLLQGPLPLRMRALPAQPPRTHLAAQLQRHTHQAQVGLRPKVCYHPGAHAIDISFSCMNPGEEAP